MGHSPSPPAAARMNGEAAAAAVDGVAEAEIDPAPPEEVEVEKIAAAPEEGPKAKDKGINSFVGSLQWPAAVKRAVGSSPVRRIQECLLGVRGGNGISSDSAVWLLGICYRMNESSSTTTTSTTASTTTASIDEETKESTSSSFELVLADFLLDFGSRIWITYRQGFEAIAQSKFTSDVGWGCMIRSGQMLFAQALVCHRLGRGWRRGDKPYAREYLEILHNFIDSPSPSCPFSIHNFIRAGNPYGVAAGSWLGPYALCHAIEALVRDRSGGGGGDEPDPMSVYVVSGDANGERGGAPVLYKADVAGKCPVLILVPLVLGLDKINPRYIPSLRETFGFPQSVGIAGGKPAASVYFVGVQDDQALYLDPHEVQKMVNVQGESLDFETASYHCSTVRKMPLDAIDPSLALGFYCRNREELDDLCERASALASRSNGAPMFTAAEDFERKQHDGGAAAGAGSSGGECHLDLDNLNLGTDSVSEEDWQILY